MPEKTILRADHVVTPFFVLRDAAVVVAEGRIEWVGASAELPDAGVRGAKSLDLGPCTLAPGFIDIHIHGGGGRHTGDSREALQEVAENVARHGTTAFLPTLGGIPDFERLLEQVRMVAASQGAHGNGAAVAGIHLEGPFLSSDEKVRGAQSVAAMRTPSIAEFDRIYEAAAGALRYMTIAPELPGAFECIAHMTRRGIVASAGHTAATYEQMDRAIRCGLRSVCHTFNGMPPMHHRNPGVVGAALTRVELSAELIGDGHHVNDTVMRVLYQAKGVDGIALITDNTRYAGMPDGRYPGDGRTVVVADGRCQIEGGGSLAGSIAPMIEIVRRVQRAVGCTLAEAVRMASYNPASVVGLSSRKGSLEPGKDADIVALDASFNVAMTMVGGRVVYGR